MLPQEDINNIGEKKKITWRWLAFLFFALPFFHFTTPFMFDIPLTTSGVGEFDISNVVEIAQKGNVKRQVVFLSIGIIGLLIISFTKNRFQMNGMLSWTLILYMVWIIFSLSWSTNLFFTTKRIVIFSMVWLAALAVASRVSLRELATFAVFISGMTLAVGIGNELRLGTLAPLNQGWRFSGIMFSVGMGKTCAFLTLSSIILASWEKRMWYRIFLTFLALIAFVFTCLTRTRGAVLSAIIVIGYYFFKVTWGKTRLQLLVVLGVIIALSASYVAIGERVLTFGKSATTLGRTEAEETAKTLTGRIPLWEYSFQYALDRPFRGYGFDTFLNPKALYKIKKELGWAPANLHSGYMGVLMGTGFIGLGLFVAILLLALKRSFQLSKFIPAYDYVFTLLLMGILSNFTAGNFMTGTSVVSVVSVSCMIRLAFLQYEEWR